MIEHEEATFGEGMDGGNFARELKGLVGRGGKFFDVGISLVGGEVWGEWN